MEAMTSSILRIMTAASVAELMACLPILWGSMTFSFIMSSTFPVKGLSPAYFLPALCCFLISMTMSMGSRPAFSARVLGMISMAEA